MELLAFAKAQGMDFVGISFVESDRDLSAVSDLLNGRSPRLLAKIETRRDIDNLEAILDVADAVMIDRGDLSLATSLEEVTHLQKQVLRRGRAHGKPVMVATEMLQSMMHRTCPTQAEVSDITNAVLDGASAIVLSDETAIGAYPVEAVAIMRRIADTSAARLQDQLDHQDGAHRVSIPHATRDAIALICRNAPVTKIVAVTMSGYAARMVAASMPRQPILAVSNDLATARSLNVLAGTEGIYVDVPFSRTSTDHLAQCLRRLWEMGKLEDDDLILVTSVGYPKAGNRMNLIEVHRVSDLRESLSWTRQPD